MSGVMEAPHAQKSPGGVWCSAPAPQEVHTVHTLLHSSRMQSASAAGWCSSLAAFVLPHGRWLQCPPFVLCHTAVRCLRSSNKLKLSPAVTMRLKSQLAQGGGPDSYAVLSDLSAVCTGCLTEPGLWEHCGCQVCPPDSQLCSYGGLTSGCSKAHLSLFRDSHGPTTAGTAGLLWVPGSQQAGPGAVGHPGLLDT